MKIFTGTLLLLISLIPGISYGVQDTGEEREVVQRVYFEGNEEYPSMVLRGIIATTNPGFFNRLLGRYGNYPFSADEVRRDVIRIERFYQRRGFHNISVNYDVEDGKSPLRKIVTFHIDENVPLRITESQVTIDAPQEYISKIQETREYERALERHDYREGRRFELIRQADVEGMFRIALEEAGFPWPEIEIQADTDSTANTTEVEIVLTPNSESYFTAFEVDGDLTVPERIVIRQTDIKQGEAYSRNTIQSAQRNIFNHHLFRFATITLPEQEHDSTLTALIRVREYEPRSVEAEAGVGREEIVRGQVAWQHRNINGTGHRLGLTGRASFIEQRAGVDYLIPYTFNARSTNVSSLFGVHRVEPAFELLQAGFNSSLIYRIQRNQTATLSYVYTLNEEIHRDQGIELPSFFSNYNTSSFLLSGYYSEGFSREQRGWVVQPSAEFSGTFGESTFTFQKFNLDVRRFQPISPSTTLAMRVNGGTIFYTQDEGLPATLRYFTGGTNSVRGWGRQELGPALPSFDDDGDFDGYIPVGGRTIFTFNVELRQQLTAIIPNFGLAGFIDGGQVWRSIGTLNERPIQFGAGGGIRYQSPIGPVRIDVAYKLNPLDQDLNIYNGQGSSSAMDRIGIHFSIGQAF